MKRILCIILALSLMLTVFAGCGKKDGTSNNAMENNADGLIASTQKEISNDGIGRSEYYAGELPFSVGDTLSEFVENGFVISDTEYSQIVEPWGHNYVRAKYDSVDRIKIEIINESDTPQPSSNCRSVRVSGDDGINSKDKFKIGVTTKDEILSTYSQIDLLENAELYSEDYLLFGTYLNNIKFYFENQILSDVEIMCIDNLFTEIQYEKGTRDNDKVPFLEMSMLQSFIDVNEFAVSGYPKSYNNLNAKFNTDTMTLVVDGIEVGFGVNGNTISELKEKGFSFAFDYNENMNKDEMISNVGIYNSADGIVMINGKTITTLSTYNPFGAEIIWTDAKFGGFTLLNPNGVSIPIEEVPTFSICGVSNDSSIKEIVDKLGLPRKIDATFESPALVTMEYAFSAGADGTFFVTFYVDALNDSIYKLDIHKV